MARIFLALMVFAGVLGTGFEAHAEKIHLVMPMRVVMAPGQNTTTMTLMNRGTEKRAYEISMTDVVMQEDGPTRRLDTFDYSAKRMLRFVPRRTELAPGEMQTVRLMVRRPSDLEDGDYHTHIQFKELLSDSGAEKSKEEGKGFRVNLETQYAVATPVVVQHGDVTGELRIKGVDKDATTDKKLKVKMAREGNSEGNGVVRVFRKTPGGLEKIAHDLTTRIYREINNRTFSIGMLEGYKPEGNLLLRLRESSSKNARILQEMDVSL